VHDWYATARAPAPGQPPRGLGWRNTARAAGSNIAAA